MVLYNVTVNVEDGVLQDWLSWMKNHHIPEIMSTGCFVENKMLRLINDDPEAQGQTFAVEYYAKSMSMVNDYLQNHAPAIAQKHVQRYMNRCVSFRTVLEEI